MWLVDQILQSGRGVLSDRYTPVYFPGDDLFAINRSRGLPVGNLPSQHWANLYLHPLDMFVKHTLKCEAYVRYNDDFVLFAPEKQTLHHWREQVTDFLQTLRLTLNERKAQVYPVKNEITFLGWQLFPQYRRLRRDNVRHAIRRLRKQQQLFALNRLSQEKLTASIRAWLAHARHGNTYRLRTKIMHRFIFNQYRSRNAATS
jgi:hypothetical protein